MNVKLSFLVNLSENIQNIYFFWVLLLQFQQLAVFSKMRQSILTLPVILSFMKFFVSQTSRTRFFLQLFNIISEATILIFLVNLPMVNIYKFYKTRILIQLPGEPREQYLSDV